MYYIVLHLGGNAKEDVEYGVFLVCQDYVTLISVAFLGQQKIGCCDPTV